MNTYFRNKVVDKRAVSMNIEQKYLIATKASSMDSNSDIHRKGQNAEDQDTCHRFLVHYFADEDILDKKNYRTVDAIKRDAFALYERAALNDRIAILTYRNENNEEVAITTVPNRLRKGQLRDLFIRIVCIQSNDDKKKLFLLVADSTSLCTVFDLIWHSQRSTSL